MKRAIAIAALLVGGVVAMLAFDAPETASANGGPHGDYTATTDRCAGCHRAHSALASDFLLKKSDAVTLCTSCHNGTGSRLDVLDGLKLNANKAARPLWNVTRWEVSAADITADIQGTLLGGGFDYVGTSAAQNPVKSTHMDVTVNAATTAAAATADQPWGFVSDGTRATYAAGGITPGDGTTPKNTGQRAAATSIPALECVSCHDPHGSSNYRILNDTVNGFAVNVKAQVTLGTRVADEGARGLETGAPADKYTGDHYYSGGQNLGAVITDTQSNIASFCSACHTAYPSDDAMAGLIAGGVTHFRHKTEAAIAGRVGPGGSKCGTPTGNCTHPENTGLGGLTLRLADTNATANEVVTCLTCHRAHGTAAGMTGYALTSEGTQNTGAGGVATDSSLLYLDNRGVCQVCHQW